MGANRHRKVLQAMNPDQYLFGYEYQERCKTCPGAMHRLSIEPTSTTYYYTCPFCSPDAFAEIVHPELYVTRYYLRYKDE